MRKLIAAVLLAVAGTAAQAVTLSWTGYRTLEAGKTYSLVVTLTDTRLNDVIGEAFNGGTECTLMSVGAEENPFSAKIVRANGWKVEPSLKEAQWNHSQSSPIGVGDITSIVMTLSGTATENNALESLKFEFRYKIENAWKKTFEFTAKDQTASVDLSSGSVTLFGGKDGLENSYSASAVLLPEPTVLALLALGVAGLALKRRTPSDAA